VYTHPENIVKTGIPRQPHKNGQPIASVYVCISYKTGKPLYYRVDTAPTPVCSVYSELVKDVVHNFITFEEAMVYCDVNGYWVDTTDWDNPSIGMIKFCTTARKVLLENGKTLKICD